MSIYCVWDSSYSVGVEEIDKQHQQLFELVNLFPENPNASEVRKAILQLFQYTREHFEFEEGVMLRMNYPRRQEHIALHNILISKLRAISLESFQDSDSVHEFKHFLYEWIIDHVGRHDKDYAQYVQKLNHAAV